MLYFGKSPAEVELLAALLAAERKPPREPMALLTLLVLLSIERILPVVENLPLVRIGKNLRMKGEDRRRKEAAFTVVRGEKKNHTTRAENAM